MPLSTSCMTRGTLDTIRCMSVCACVCVCVCVCVHVYNYVYMHTLTCEYIYSCSHAYIYIYLYIQPPGSFLLLFQQVCRNVRPACPQSCQGPCLYMYTCACIQIRKMTHPPLPTRMTPPLLTHVWLLLFPQECHICIVKACSFI